MLENPSIPLVLVDAIGVGSENPRGAENPQERLGISTDSENPQRPYAGPLPPTRKRMRWSATHGDVGNRKVHPVRVQLDITSASEIPCRVSSDLHEWRNDLGAVSTRDSAKLHYE